MQLELPWALGPPDGRYLVRPANAAPDAAPAYVLVLATLGAKERRRLAAVRRRHKAEPESEPAPVPTTRATVVDVGGPLDAADQAAGWLGRADEAELAEGVAVLNRALHAYRLATADPHVHGIGRRDLLVARLGYGEGEQVADGLWTQARELVDSGHRRRRSKLLEDQARLAALLSGRRAELACEELALRARLDLDEGREREAALETLSALDAALAELTADPAARAFEDRLQELRGLRNGAAAAAQAALAGLITLSERKTSEHALDRLEAALRARAAEPIR